MMVKRFSPEFFLRFQEEYVDIRDKNKIKRWLVNVCLYHIMLNTIIICDLVLEMNNGNCSWHMKTLSLFFFYNMS